MTAFRRKPMPEEINQALRGHASVLPSAVNSEGKGGKPKAPPTVQVNFNVSEDFARLIAKLAREAGSTRRLFAKWAADQGHDVPDADLNPIDNRRRWQS